MYITDKRKPHTVPFGSLNRGDVFAMDDADEHNKFYLMKTENEHQAVLLGEYNGDNYRSGEIWDFSDEAEVEPLRSDLTVWAK